MKSTVILFVRNGIGEAPEELSQTLVRNYLGLLKDEKRVPVTMLFYGEGIKLLCKGSSVLDSLSALADRGVKLIACKTCLNYFNLTDDMLIGQIGTMADILTIQLEADKVITP
jgi:intracellular sulfur oxidation DsrE/DsrF family protein